jgi:hypothetical protein
MISKRGLLALLASGLAAVAFAGTQSATLELPEATSLNGKELAPGRYKISWTGSGPEVAVTLAKSGKIVAEARGKLVAIGRKAEDDGVVLQKNPGGGTCLTKVLFSGKKDVLVFSGS